MVKPTFDFLEGEVFMHKHAIEDIEGLDNPFLFKGQITISSDFPTLSEVQNGWLYQVVADVTDDDPSKTNTGLDFQSEDEIVWDGSTWVYMGNTKDVDYLQLETTLTPPPYKEGRLFYDNANKTLAQYNSEADITQQIGQELFMRVYNESGSTILNGKAITVVGVDSNGVPKIDLAIASNEVSALNCVGVSTHNIENNSFGFITTQGFVNDVDTSTLTEGSLLYLSDTVAGGFSTTKPDSPSYDVKFGGVAKQDAVNGIIYVEMVVGDNTQSTFKFYNGSILENHTVDVVSDGTTVTLTLDDTGDTLSLFFDGEFTVIDVPASINLVAGTDEAPQENWVYIPKSTKVLTTNTTGYPTNEQVVRIADVLVQSAATAQTQGVRKVHAWTDYLADSVGQGHLSDLNFWIRQQHASWVSGVAVTTTPDVGVSGSAITLANSSGVVLQLHNHLFPAQDTAVSDEILVYNDSITPNRPITEFSGTSLPLDADGTSTANKYFNVILWGSVSEDTEDCELFINLPGGVYTNESSALQDIDRTVDVSIPDEFRGTGFLIAQITLQRSGANIKIPTGGLIDLRGTTPGVVAGSGTGVSITEFPDNSFKILDNIDPTKVLQFEANGITTGNTRTLTSPDKDGTIALLDDIGSLYVPYTGATASVDLGANTITASKYLNTGCVASGDNSNAFGTSTASQDHCFAAGDNAVASGANAIAIGPYVNTLAANSVCLGGNSNTNEGINSVILSCANSLISLGSDNSFVAGGYGQKAQAKNGVILGGFNNTLTNQFAGAINSTDCDVAGYKASVIGGGGHTNTASFSIIIGGYGSTTTILGNNGVLIGCTSTTLSSAYSAAIASDTSNFSALRSGFLAAPSSQVTSCSAVSSIATDNTEMTSTSNSLVAAGSQNKINSSTYCATLSSSSTTTKESEYSAIIGSLSSSIKGARNTIMNSRGTSIVGDNIKSLGTKDISLKTSNSVNYGYVDSNTAKGACGTIVQYTTTTNSTQRTLTANKDANEKFVLADGSTYGLSGTVFSSRKDTPELGRWKFEAVVDYSGGISSIAWSSVTNQVDESGVNAVAISTDGFGTFEVKVTGNNGASYDWICRMDYERLDHTSGGGSGSGSGSGS